MMSATCGLTIYDSRNYLVLIDIQKAADGLPVSTIVEII